MTEGLSSGWSAWRRHGAALTLAVLPASVEAQDAPDPLATPEPPIACMVNGYDLVLTNKGAEVLAVGTRIAWQVPFARREGVFELTRAMEVGQMAVVAAANGANYLNARTPCMAELAPVSPP